MKSVINKHKHHQRLWPLFPNGVYYNKKIIDYKVCFDITCKYDLNSDDNKDVNKLFGLSFTWSPHKESVRFGWNYNQANGKIRIFYYCYVDGKRLFGELCEVPLYKDITLILSIISHGYVFEVEEGGRELCGPTLIEHNHNHKLSYRLGDYFGGNRPAPHKIVKKIEESNFRRNEIGNY